MMRLSKIKSYIIKYQFEIIDCILIVGVISIVGFKLHAWTGDLKGDDIYLHASMVKYILNNFPHINWFQQFYNGYPPLEFSLPAYYCAIALEHVVTTLSVPILMQITLFISLVATGVCAYVFAKSVGIQRLGAVAFSLLIFTMSVTWNHVLIGGSWVRVAAFPFLFISLAIAYKHVQQINKSGESTKTYVTALIVFSVSAMIEPLVWQWTFAFLLGIYIVGIIGWRRKIFYVTKVFLPVAALVAWFYVPLFMHYIASTRSALGTVAHDTTLMQWHWLIYLPSRNSWSIDIGPLVLPLALLGLVFTFIYRRRIVERFNLLKLEWKIATLFFFFVIYFFLYGWLPMPQSTYLMAAGDYAFWFGVALIILSILVFGILAKVQIFSHLGSIFAQTFQYISIIIVILTIVAILPFLKATTQADNPFNMFSNSDNIKSVVAVAKANSGNDYRLYNQQRILARWLYFADPSVLISGGRANYVPHKYYSQEANAIISYRFTSKQEQQSIYSEDRPQVWPLTIGGDDNYYSSMFWLDWYGASGTILLPGFYPQAQNAQGYASRPQFFQEFETTLNHGVGLFYKYIDSSPIAVSTQAHVVAVPFQQGNAPAFYNSFLSVLSCLNLNSQWIVPVKLENNQNLAKFNTALVDSTEYIQNKNVLDKFASDGGHLVVVDAGKSAPASVTAQLLNNGLSFQVMASSVIAPKGSTILAETQGEALAYEMPIGNGTINFSGISLNGMTESNSPVAGVLLMEEVAPEIDLNTAYAQIYSSSVSYVTQGTVANVAHSTSVSNKNGETSLTYTTNKNLQHNQINLTLPLPIKLTPDSNAIISFSLWSDGSPISYIDVTLGQQGKTGFLYYTLPDNVWNGWKTFVVPISCFQLKEGNVINYFDSLTLCFNENPPYQAEPNIRLFNLQDVIITTLINNSSYVDLNGTWQQAGKFTVNLGDNKDVLWKESYMPSWNVTDNQGRKVDYYFAGPGMIYLVAPNDSQSLTFIMPVPTDRIIGIAVSALSLLGLISFLLIKRKNSVRTRLTNRSD